MKPFTSPNLALASLAALASPAIANGQDITMGECTKDKNLMQSCRHSTQKNFHLEKSVICIDGEWEVKDTCAWLFGHCSEYHGDPTIPGGKSSC